MKHLPCILSFSAVFGLLFLTVSAVLGVPLPYESIASYVLGISCGVGVVGFLLADYGPGKSPSYLAARVQEPKREIAQAVVSRRRALRPIDLSFDDTITVNSMTIGVGNDPETVSMM